MLNYSLFFTWEFNYKILNYQVPILAYYQIIHDTCWRDQTWKFILFFKRFTAATLLQFSFLKEDNKPSYQLISCFSMRLTLVNDWELKWCFSLLSGRFWKWRKQIVGPDLYYKTGHRSMMSLSYSFIWQPQQSHEARRKSTSNFFKFLVLKPKDRECTK